MTTAEKKEETDSVARMERLNANLARVEELTQRLTAAVSARRMHDPALDGPAPDVYVKAAAAWMASIASTSTTSASASMTC